MLGLEVSLLVLLCCAIAPVAVSFVKQKNKVDMILIVVLLGHFTLILLRLFRYSDVSVDFTAGALDIFAIVGLAVISSQVIFLLYLKEIRKFYTFPAIVSFYIGFGLVLNGNVVGFLIYELSASAVILYVLVKTGLKNRNGILLCLGIFVAINAVANSIFIIVVQSILRIIALSILLLGTSGFVDKFLLYDKSEAEKVRNIWISHMVIKEK